MIARLIAVGFFCLMFGFFGGIKYDRFNLARTHQYFPVAPLVTTDKPHETNRKVLGAVLGSRMAPDGRGMEVATEGGTVEIYNLPVVPLGAEAHILYYSNGKIWFDWKDSDLMYSLRD